MNTPSSLTDQIQQLVDQRQQHVDAMTAIDNTLAQINQILGTPMAPAAKPALAATPAPAKATRGRPRGRYGTNAQELLLEFVKAKGNPTSKEIQQHWQNAGRRGNASPILVGLQKTGQLKRIPIPGQHSSHYVLAGSADAPARGTAAPAAKPAKGRRVRGSFATTGKESILAFLKREGSATSSEIKQHWQSEGRKGKVENELGKMFKAKQLTRTPLVGKPGNRYALAGAPAPSRKTVAASAAKPAPSSEAAMSGREFILHVVRWQKNPTTADIEARWKSAGRTGRANKTLGRMVEAKELKREPVKDGQGSRYSLA